MSETLIINDFKRCSKCATTKQNDEFARRFYPRADGTFALQASCKSCDREAAKKRYRLNISNCRESKRRWKEENKEKCRDWQREYQCQWKDKNPERAHRIAVKWREGNREATQESSLRWRNNNLDKARESKRKWGAKNPDKVTAHTVKRHAAKLKAIPAWVGCAENLLIGKFYTKAKSLSEITGIPHEVDHIIPLQGKTVCGLHCPSNLQVLTASENRSKHNRLVGEV